MNRKIKGWFIVCGYTLLIYSSLPFAPGLWKNFRQFLGESIDYLPAIGLIIMGLFILFYLVFYRRAKNPLIYLCFILIGLVYGYGLDKIEIPFEKVHFLEYGLLSYLVFRALRSDVRGNSIYFFSSLIVFCIGFLDEGIQYLLPGRVYEFRDVLLNAISGVLGLAVIGLISKC